VKVSRRTFGAEFVFDWFSIHDLMVVAISFRPFGPSVAGEGGRRDGRDSFTAKQPTV